MSEVLTSVVKSYSWRVQFAAHVIRQGGVIAHPTESVWGLACDPFNPKAIATILKLKRRPLSKGLILISGSMSHFEPLLAHLPQTLQTRFYGRQNRPSTWLVPDTENQVPRSVKGKHETVAIRVVDHDVLTDLTHILGHPIVSSSANPAGLAPAKSIFKVHQYFSNHLDYILPAALGGFSRPSIIRDLRTAEIIRA